MENSILSQSILSQSTEYITGQPSLSPMENLIKRVDGEGKYQLISFVVFSLLWFLTSWLLLGMSFFFDDAITCTDTTLTDPDKCLEYICSQHPQDRAGQIASHSRSITFEFQNYMICDDYKNQISILQSMLFFGALIGFFIIPYIADNCGRKIGIQIAWVIGTVSVLLTWLANSPLMVGIGLFFLGFGTNPAITLCYSFINQQCLGHSRQRFGVGVQVSLALGESTIALVFLSSLTWRQIMMILFFMFLGTNLLIHFLLLETPMYLMEQDKKKALECLNKIAKINNKQPIDEEQFLIIYPEIQPTEQQKIIAAENKRLGLKDLFKYKSVRWISISSGFIFFGIQTIYYSTSLNLGSVGFSKTINQIIFGVSEMIGYIAAEFIIAIYPRKISTYIGMGVSSGFCFILGLLLIFQNSDNQHILKWLEAAGLIGNRFVLCCSWAIFYVFVAELYPTQTRSLGFGWTSCIGMIGSTISPYITQLSEAIHVNSWFPPAVVGFIAFAFVYCLPQTFGKPMKDVIEERMQVLKSEKTASTLANQK